MQNSQATLGSNCKSRTCLLIDDDEDDKEIFAIALAEVNPDIRCYTAADGIAALDLLQDTAFIPEFIFLDLNMPLMSGRECLVEIRKRPHLDGSNVIIFSTSSSEKDIQETRELGASGFITKPPLISTLAKKLSEVFENQPAEKKR